MKKNSEGIVYLSGGGDENKTINLDSSFLKNLSNKNILFIPIAKTSDMNGYKKSCKWVTNKLNRLSKDPISVSLIVDLNKCKNIDEFGAIYIGGGNTYKLLKLMKESNFLPIFKKYIQNGGIVYGASAGAVLMGKKISTYIEEKYIIENKKYNYTLSKGLSLVGEYSIITHFHKNEYKKIKEYFKKNSNPVIAIPEGTGVLLKDNNITVIGNKTVNIFRKNGTLNKIEPNTVFMI